MERLNSSDPSKLGPFEILGRLGTGGMGGVYLGRSANGVLVAVKVVHPALAGDEQHRQRLRREVVAMSEVGSPNIASVIDSDLEAPVPWIAMEYIDGPTLEEAVSRHGPMAPDRVLALAAGLAEALAALHQAGWVHRDLKPSNVIVGREAPKLIDLGIAHALDAKALTTTGLQSGTLNWMAPEQLSDAAESSASDMFAWACLTCYAVTGRHPYGAGRSEAAAARIMQGGRPDLTGTETLAGGLRALIVSCLDHDPSRRPSAQDVAMALRSGATQLNPASIDRSLARTTETQFRAPQADYAPAGGHPLQPDARTDRKRRHVVGILVAIGVLAAIGMSIGSLALVASRSDGTSGTRQARETTDSSGERATPTTEGTKPAGPSPDSTDTAAPEPDQAQQPPTFVPKEQLPDPEDTVLPDPVADVYPVSWGDGVTVHTGTSKGSPSVKWLPYQTVVHVVCRTRGESAITRTGKVTTWWDYIDSPVSGYLSDARINTGGFPPDVPIC